MPNIFLNVKQVLLLAWFGLQFFVVVGQHTKNWTELGDNAFSQGDYYGASIYYDLAREKNPGNVTLIYKLAESLRLNNDYEKAEDYYKYLSLKTDKHNFDRVLFWLATMEKYNGKYSSSIKTWRKVLQKASSDTTSYDYKKASQEIKSCDFAINYKNRYVPISINNIGDGVNTNDAEFGTWLKDDSLLYFSSLRGEFNEDLELLNPDDYLIKIYLAKKEKEQWVTEGALNEIINVPDYHTGNGSFSADEEKFYFSRCDLLLRCDLYQTRYDNEGWHLAEPMNELNVDEFTSTQPTLVEFDGVEVLLFVSDRPGGMGKTDIWFAIRETDTSFTAPKNLGPPINTPGNEIAPFFYLPDSTLYFSSDWHEGFGGFDVFQSTLPWLDSQVRVENMGKPINTSVNDYYFTKFGFKGFLTSNRKGGMGNKGETCCNDLYEVSFTEEKKEHFLANDNNGLNKGDEISSEQGDDLSGLNDLLPLSLYFDNDRPDPKTISDTTSTQFDSLLTTYTDKKSLFVRKAGKGMKRQEKKEEKALMEMFFDERVVNAKNKLDMFLEKLYQYLNDGGRVNLVVRGYASPLAESAYNLALTKRRIVSFKNMLMNDRGGQFKPYLERNAINGGSLNISALPFGENMALKSISDQAKDESSIYSFDASLERKIDLVAVTPINEEKLEPRINFDNWVRDVGTISADTKLIVRFPFTNTGNAPLVIKNIVVSCGCTLPELTQTVYQPGERGVISVNYDPAGQHGRQLKTISVVTNGEPSQKKLILTGMITIH